MSILIEEWRPVKDYEGIYEVSDWARVRSCERKVLTKRGYWTYKSVILKPSFNEGGYYVVNLSKDAESKLCRVHILVAEAFLPNPENKPVVGHIKKLPDGTEDKTANEAWNIRWMTYEENNNYGTIKERHSASHKDQTNDNLKKDVYQYSLDGKFIRKYKSSKHAAEHIGCHKETIARACRTKEPKKGYRWSYEPL